MSLGIAAPMAATAIVITGEISDLPSRHHHDTLLAQGETFAVHLGIEADAITREDTVVHIDNGASQASPPAYPHIVHDDAILDLDILFDHGLTPNDGIGDARTLVDNSGRGQ